ncbi:hypothetical protein REPUB_Repub03eG0120200 [Reevesia pubescens]
MVWFAPRETNSLGVLFEEWVTSLLQARKAVEVLESRNGLYVLYMDRVTGDLAKLVGQVSSLQKLNSDMMPFSVSISAMDSKE